METSLGFSDNSTPNKQLFFDAEVRDISMIEEKWKKPDQKDVVESKLRFDISIKLYISKCFQICAKPKKSDRYEMI